jgi:hypothetical protein
MKQQDWDQRKTSCQAFIRVPLTFQEKFGTMLKEAISMDFNIVVNGDSFSGLHPSAGILPEYTGQVRIWSS